MKMLDTSTIPCYTSTIVKEKGFSIMKDLQVVYTREAREGGKWVVKENTSNKASEFDKLVDRARTWVPIDRNRFDLVRVTDKSYMWHEVATSKDGSGVRITLEYKGEN